MVQQQSVRLGFVLAVESVESELLLLLETDTVHSESHIIIRTRTWTCAHQETYMSEEAVRHSEWVFPAGLQLPQEELTVEVQKFLQVPKDDRALSPQVLRDVDPVHLREVVVDDVAQRANVLPLRGHHLLHDVTQLTAHRHSDRSHTSNSQRQNQPGSVPQTPGFIQE